MLRRGRRQRAPGATESRLKTSDVTAVSEALVAVSLPAHVHRDSADLLDFIEAAQVSQAVRRSGSAALNLAHVASGALDAFWATQIHAWDVAAGILLIREAGGIVTGRDGQAFRPLEPALSGCRRAGITPRNARSVNRILRPVDASSGRKP